MTLQWYRSPCALSGVKTFDYFRNFRSAKSAQQCARPVVPCDSENSADGENSAPDWRSYLLLSPLKWLLARLLTHLQLAQRPHLTNGRTERVRVDPPI